MSNCCLAWQIPCKSLSFINFLPSFFFNDPPTTEIYTLSLHDALPICERSARQPLRRRAGAPHGFGRKVGFERDVEAAMRLVVGVGEIRQRRRIALRPRESGGAKRRQRLPHHHPGRDGGREILAEERAERLVFPRLHVAR